MVKASDIELTHEARAFRAAEPRYRGRVRRRVGKPSLTISLWIVAALVAALFLTALLR